MRALHHRRVAPLSRRVLHERLQNLGSGSPAARLGPGRHPPDSPVAGLALGSDEPDRDQLVAVESAERDGVARLVLGELLDRQVGAQHVAAERAGLREGDRAEVQLGHRLTG